MVPRVAGQDARIPVDAAWSALLSSQDTDGDKKITVHDQGTRRFMLRDEQGGTHPVEGTYRLSVLLQELTRAKEAGLGAVPLSRLDIDENPVERTSRLIREVFWDSLTRHIDARGIGRILSDTKISSASGVRYLYVPASDPESLGYFQKVAREEPELKLRVEPIPDSPSPSFAATLSGKEGLLSLQLEKKGGQLVGTPFVVPGGRFNEMYGWDSYFIALGLLQDGRVELARGLAENLAYEIVHYGKILNANRTYYLTRSQPPFLTSLARAVYEKGPRDEASRRWLSRILSAAIVEYETVWTRPPRLDAATGLSRYHGDGEGPCPEVEPGHYDAILKPFAARVGMSAREFLHAYASGRIRSRELASLFESDRALRESGHDTTYRFGDHAGDFLTVDLSSLLYKYETDIAELLDRDLEGQIIVPGIGRETADLWRHRATRRRAAAMRLLWDERAGTFFDYDMKRHRRSGYYSATMLYPLWAGLATPAQATRVVRAMERYLEEPAGLAATAEVSRGKLSSDRPPRQWDYPYGWAPHQMLAWSGLDRYGFHAVREQLVYRWLYTITKNAADYNGTVPEKMNVVTGSHEVFAEYGNVGTHFRYLTKEGFGWMNASYEVGLSLLSAPRLADLRALVPPPVNSNSASHSWRKVFSLQEPSDPETAIFAPSTDPLALQNDRLKFSR